MTTKTMTYFHDLDELEHDPVTFFGVFLLEDLRSTPERDVVEVHREASEVGAALLALVLRPQQHLGDLKK